MAEQEGPDRVITRPTLVRAADDHRQKLWASAMFHAPTTHGVGWQDRLPRWERDALGAALVMADKEAEKWRDLTLSLGAELENAEVERDAALAKLEWWSKDRGSPA